MYLGGLPFTIYRYLFIPEFPRYFGPRDYIGHATLERLVWTALYVQLAIQTLAIAAVCEIMHWWSMSKPKNDQLLEDGEPVADVS
jgi:hypothetical protein